MTVQIDARGLLCPLPVLRLRKRLMALPRGTRVTLLATDPAAVIDVPHFCAESGHRLIARREVAPGETEYIVERGPACAIAAD
ncbi:sulfurtransferase TusA family protein [Paracoccus sp. pheM1]|uniref:sulfurtransferase TusA family protein n=1 Tax=Paracoccus sp. pheM1 TaxID=2831675 RepID=UPI001BDB72E9|nr:sulfurtransferase TusA family protein [Paracoccus sp. pheM1]MBT0779988.1 sulfurtransferase TusA family protein [Paracoccus sp. pheM1]